MSIGLLFRFVAIGGLVPLLLLGCRSANDVQARKCLIRSISTTEGGYIEKGMLTFDYNDNRQLIKATLSFRNTQATLTQSFSYSPGRIEMTVLPVPTESGVVSATYSLNTAGNITRLVSTERVYGSASIQLNEQRFNYDESGFLSSQEDANGIFRGFTYQQDNFFVERYYRYGDVSLAYNYLFYPDTPLTVTTLGGVSTFAPFYTQGLFGRRVKNAVRETANFRGTTSYIYAYDDQGNVTSVSQTYMSSYYGTPEETTVLYYTYTCP